MDGAARCAAHSGVVIRLVGELGLRRMVLRGDCGSRFRAGDHDYGHAALTRRRDLGPFG